MGEPEKNLPALVDSALPLTIRDMKDQVNLIQGVMKSVMKKGTHYDVLPGCNKPSILKAGCEKLLLTFRLSADYGTVREDLPNAHREYESKCTLTHIPTGDVHGSGIGMCTSMEAKYRYRQDAEYEILDEEIPKDYKERKKEYRKQGLGCKKIESVWEWVRFGDTTRVENPDIADTYNTILKMSEIRALRHATLGATAASDIFTQERDQGEPGDRQPNNRGNNEGGYAPQDSERPPKPERPPPTREESEAAQVAAFRVKVLARARAAGCTLDGMQAHVGKKAGEPFRYEDWLSINEWLDEEEKRQRDNPDEDPIPF